MPRRPGKSPVKSRARELHLSTVSVDNSEFHCENVKGDNGLAGMLAKAAYLSTGSGCVSQLRTGGPVTRRGESGQVEPQVP